VTTTVIDLEFETGATGQPPLGDIASSLVSIDELLRDLVAVAYPPSAEFRDIQVADIVMRSPLKVTLSLRAIPPEAIKAFQDICREIILSRDRGSSRSAIDIAEAVCARQGITEREVQRIRTHIATLQDAKVPLKAVVVK
jgi:hypothetical protein